MNDFHNLDTSFVKFDTLVRYLCRRGFVGCINLKFEGYRGEIAVSSAGKLRVSEFDDKGKRVRGGQTAFAGMIVRSEAPGGIINVIEHKALKASLLAEGNDDVDTAAETSNPNDLSVSKLIRHVRIQSATPASGQQVRGLLSQLADFPYDLTNHFEDEAASPTDNERRLEMMIDVTSDLLSTIERALDRAGLDFALAFRKACSDVSDKYPFLEPEKLLFRYSDGFVYISPDIDLGSLATGIGDVLVCIFDRLSSIAKLSKAFRFAVQKIQLLATTRKDEFAATGLGLQVERLLKHP